MVTMVKAGKVNEYRGKSTDTKPTEHVPNGSTFYEIDTVKLYAFDEAATSWIEQ